MKGVVLINPPISGERGDYTGTGAVHWPIILAYVAEILRPKYDVRILDMFGSNPSNMTTVGNIIRFGADFGCIGDNIKEDDTVVIYSGAVIGHTTVLDIIRHINKLNRNNKVIVIENPNFVMAYPLDLFGADFKAVGAIIIPGYPFSVIEDVIDGKCEFVRRGEPFDVLGLKFPTWEGFPLDNYWTLEHAHAPKTNSKYIQIYTSFGCPGICRFCQSKYLNESKWIPRGVDSVIDEMKYWISRGVNEFHWEELNPTVDKQRIMDICRLIGFNGMKVDFKIASGTKMDDIDDSLIIMMGKHGLSYLSFSPESGNSSTLIFMNKLFDHKHALDILDTIKKNVPHVITQACFVLGYPGANDSDIDDTASYISRLTRHGLDEIALFNFVPTPGSQFKNYKIDTDLITFSSNWSQDSAALKSKRTELVAMFYLGKIWYSPIKTVWRFSRTKTWMTMRRLIKGFLLRKIYGMFGIRC